ncbi:MAG: hypothetical protein ACI9N1_002046, partial [Flavobacteriales bacterium]
RYSTLASNLMFPVWSKNVPSLLASVPSSYVPGPKERILKALTIQGPPEKYCFANGRTSEFP